MWSSLNPRSEDAPGGSPAGRAKKRGVTVDGTRIQPTADVDDSAVLGAGTIVWHLAQIRENARLGRDCIVGRGAYVGPGVIIGDNVKLQNYALAYEPARLEDNVFIGPAAVLTNDIYPRGLGCSGRGGPGGRVRRRACRRGSGPLHRPLGAGCSGCRGDPRCARLRSRRGDARAADRLGRPRRCPPGAVR
jgi:hypothetical protein